MTPSQHFLLFRQYMLTILQYVLTCQAYTAMISAYYIISIPLGDQRVHRFSICHADEALRLKMIHEGKSGVIPDQVFRTVGVIWLFHRGLLSDTDNSNIGCGICWSRTSSASCPVSVILPSRVAGSRRRSSGWDAYEYGISRC